MDRARHIEEDSYENAVLLVWCRHCCGSRGNLFLRARADSPCGGRDSGIPPHAARGAEEVRIEVQRVRETPVRERERERERLGRAVQVDVTARVLRVNRSRERIHDGEEIHISYVTHRREQNKFGPGEPPIPEERKMYPAYLQKVEGQRRLFCASRGHVHI